MKVISLKWSGSIMLVVHAYVFINIVWYIRRTAMEIKLVHVCQ